MFWCKRNYPEIDVKYLGDTPLTVNRRNSQEINALAPCIDNEGAPTKYIVYVL